jgi:hypothetical protein
MADTAPAANNKPVAFGAKGAREMTGNRVNAEDRPVDGKRPAADKKPKLRKAGKRAMKRGMISEKAAKRHFGGV